MVMVESTWIHLWVFNFIPLIFLPISVPIPSIFYHYCTVIQLDSSQGILIQRAMCQRWAYRPFSTEESLGSVLSMKNTWDRCESVAI